MNTVLLLTFLSVSNTFSLPPNLLSSLCYVESKHDVNAVHHDDGGSDSLGVCQIKYSTAKDLGYKGTVKQLMNPIVNVYYAAKYLHHQLLRYKGNTVNAIIAYNKGHAGHLTHTDYSDKVLKQWEIQK